MDPPDPTAIRTLSDLTAQLDLLRRRAANDRQLRLSVRDLGRRAGVPPSTLNPYLRGDRLFPAAVLEAVLTALGVERHGLRPWLDARERVEAAPRAQGPGRPLPDTRRYTYAVRGSDARVGLVTGYLRRVRCADIWVNPENTAMEMARFNDYSVSAIIRYQGATRDALGGVVDDVIADELRRAATGHRPVAPATVLTTGSGALLASNGVRHVIHVAVVEGQPGSGYRQVADVGRCATAVLAEAERLGGTAILVPLLGTGAGGADVPTTAGALLGATVDHLTGRGNGSRLATVYFLAHTDVELAACRTLFTAHPDLTPD